MNYYQILGIKATATDAEIESAFEKAAAKTNDIERQLELHMAKTALLDPSTRDRFDEELLRSLRRQVCVAEAEPVYTRQTLAILPSHSDHPRVAYSESDGVLLLRNFLIWFTMAMATVFIFFFIALIK